MKANYLNNTISFIEFNLFGGKADWYYGNTHLGTIVLHDILEKQITKRNVHIWRKKIYWKFSCIEYYSEKKTKTTRGYKIIFEIRCTPSKKNDRELVKLGIEWKLETVSELERIHLIIRAIVISMNHSLSLQWNIILSCIYIYSKNTAKTAIKKCAVIRHCESIVHLLRE